MYIYFYFNSPNFKWTVASVIFWITSRADILVTKTVLSNYWMIKVVCLRDRIVLSPLLLRRNLLLLTQNPPM